jgi:hypothetical protein
LIDDGDDLRFAFISCFQIIDISHLFPFQQYATPDAPQSRWKYTLFHVKHSMKVSRLFHVKHLRSASVALVGIATLASAGLACYSDSPRSSKVFSDSQHIPIIDTLANVLISTP